jgi:uncharacterized protein (DUF433 family)
MKSQIVMTETPTLMMKQRNCYLIIKIKQLKMVKYQEIIKRDPNKRFGKPCIRETRISVYDVLNWLANEMTIKDIVADFPELNENDILACLAYAADKERKIENV